MAPPDTHVMKVPHFTKGGPHGDKIRFPDQEDISQETTTVQDTITTVMNTISSTIQETMIGNTNSSIPSDEGGFSEMTNSSVTNNANMNATFDQNPGGITTSTGTSFEEITTTLMDGMHMEHMNNDEGYNTVLFIVLGIVLGILIIAAIVLGVIYSHYKKRGFQEISGEQGTVDPQSMKQLQQASSQDALLDK